MSRALNLHQLVAACELPISNSEEVHLIHLQRQENVPVLARPRWASNVAGLEHSVNTSYSRTLIHRTLVNLVAGGRRFARPRYIRKAEMNSTATPSRHAYTGADVMRLAAAGPAHGVADATGSTLAHACRVLVVVARTSFVAGSEAFTLGKFHDKELHGLDAEMPLGGRSCRETSSDSGCVHGYGSSGSGPMWCSRNASRDASADAALPKNIVKAYVVAGARMRTMHCPDCLYIRRGDNRALVSMRAGTTQTIAATAR